MLSSITPLGERGQGRKWVATATWYVAGSIAGGGLLGGALGLVGGAVPTPPVVATAAVVMLAVVGGLVDLSGARLPTVRRQVNEDWLGQYRSWVIGGGYGVQLGAGLVTIVTTAAVHVTFAAALLTGSAAAGAIVGAVFGGARAVPVLGLRRATTPERLGETHRRLDAWAPGAHRVAVSAQCAVGLVGVAAVTIT